MPYSASEFEVQGVNFRSGTIDQASKVGVVGHVENTSSGTVTGKVQGNQQSVSQMKEWLQNTGPPGAKIDKCNISNERHDLDKLSYNGFEKH